MSSKSDSLNSNLEKKYQKGTREYGILQIISVITVELFQVLCSKQNNENLPYLVRVIYESMNQDKVQVSEIEGARFSGGEREGLWLCGIQRTARDTKK